MASNQENKAEVMATEPAIRKPSLRRQEAISNLTVSTDLLATPSLQPARPAMSPRRQLITSTATANVAKRSLDPIHANINTFAKAVSLLLSPEALMETHSYPPSESEDLIDFSPPNSPERADNCKTPTQADFLPSHVTMGSSQSVSQQKLTQSSRVASSADSGDLPPYLFQDIHESVLDMLLRHLRYSQIEPTAPPSYPSQAAIFDGAKKALISALSILLWEMICRVCGHEPRIEVPNRHIDSTLRYEIKILERDIMHLTFGNWRNEEKLREVGKRFMWVKTTWTARWRKSGCYLGIAPFVGASTAYRGPPQKELTLEHLLSLNLDRPPFGPNSVLRRRLECMLEGREYVEDRKDRMD